MVLSGRTCVITGASSGLGLEVSKRLANLGAKTVLVCRSQEKGEGALREIQMAAPDSSVDLVLCDLASMQSVRSFVGDLQVKYSDIDVLFNNAACMKAKRAVTEDGFETMFQVNYLSPFLLSVSLVDMLRESQSGQIINNGMPADKYRIDFDNLQCDTKFGQYSSFFHAKLCLLMSGLELAQRSEGAGVSVTSQNPGSFKSDLVREVPWPAGWFKNLFSGSVDDAADNVVYLATLPKDKRGTGKVFDKREEKPLTEYWKNEGVRERLWSTTESLLH